MVAVGEVVAGRYRLIRPLAAGGMGRVWLADDPVGKRPVAVKQCVVPAGLRPAERDLLSGWTLREACAFARVAHPSVVRVHEVVPDPDGPWIVMEYVPSRSLLQVVKQSGPLPPDRVAEIGLALLGGLTAASRAGVLHLDVKPGNVLVADDGRIVLIDFGPVVTEEGIGALAGAGIVLGSPKYIAPERLFDGVSTASADLWSLGATLYFAVEGRPPYLRPTTADTLRALAVVTPDRPLRAGPLAGVLEGLLQRAPDARITPEEAEAELRAVAAGPRIEAASEDPRTVAASRDPRPPLLRRRAVLVAAGVAAATALAAAAGTSAQPPPDARAAGSPPPSPAPFRLPAGYRWWTDPAGFRVAVPAGWRGSRGADGSTVFAAPGGGPVLRAGGPAPAPADVVSALIAEERAVRLDGYRRIRIEPSDLPPGAVWEYTYRRAGLPVRVLERLVVADRRAYRVRWQAPRAAWAAGLPVWDVVVASVRPV